IERGAGGLFNTMGTQLYTSPDKRYATAVLERRPGTDPFTKLPLVPVVDASSLAETALRLDGSTGCVTLGNPPALRLPTAVTMEAWVKPAAAGGMIMSKATPGQQLGFSMYMDGGGNLALDQGGATVASTRAVTTGAYHHVAAVVDSAAVTLYLDGEAVGRG